MIVGIDPGLVCMGVVVCKDDGSPLHAFTIKEAHEDEQRQLWTRAAIIAGRVRFELRSWITEGTFTFIEDAAYNAKFQSESVASVRQALYERLRPAEPVSIQEGKKALTGNGHAHKDAMVSAGRRVAAGLFADKRWNKAETEAVADALGIALAGAAKIRERRLIERAEEEAK